MSRCPYWRGFDAPQQCTRDCRGFQCRHREEQRDALQARADKAAPRRFTGEPPTGFGAYEDQPQEQDHAKDE
jgi:hypothetical protein